MLLEPVPGDYRPPGLVREPVYHAQIPKKLISRVIEAVRAGVPGGAENMQHVKRVQPVPDRPDHLDVLLCAQARVSEEDLRAVLAPVMGVELALGRADQARYPARTKEEAQAWSREVWPVMWRGNTAAQPPTLSDADHEQATSTLAALAAPAGRPQCTARCWIRDPAVAGAPVVGRGTEDTARTFSESHAVMQAVAAVARSRAAGDGGYLCLGMDVYCDTEPCVMCSMALVHSRIGRLFYIQPSPCAKGAIATYCLHGRSQLNHTFEAWRAREGTEKETRSGQAG